MLHYQLTLLTDTPAITGTAAFPPDFAAFQGHFPNNPILPAFMHIQAALDLLALAGIQTSLHRVQSAKFLHPIKPEHLVHIFITPLQPAYYEAVLTVQDQTVSHFQLHLL